MKVENRYSYQILKVLAFKIYFIDFSQNNFVSQIKKLHNNIHCVAYVYAGVIFGQKKNFFTSMHVGKL